MEMRFISKFLCMIELGIQNIGLNKKRNFRQHISKHSFPTVEERWTKIGFRLKQSVQRLAVPKNANFGVTDS